MAQKQQSAFMRWYNSYKGQWTINIIYSAGASVVIIGALFKILHWPGASEVLMVGMFTESFLFMIGVLERPHAAYHWEEVFPQLLGYGADPELLEAHKNDPRPNLVGGAVATGSNAPKAETKVPAITEDDLKPLREGINKLGETANQLASLGSLAQTTNNLSARMDQAGEAASAFAASQTSLSAASQSLGNQYQALGSQYQTLAAGLTAQYQSLGDQYKTISADLTNVANQTKAYDKGMEAVNAQVSSLNAVYELQLKGIEAQRKEIEEQSKLIATQSAAINAQAGHVNAVGASLEQLSAQAKEAQVASAAYLKAQQTLATQVADLNKVYGNMLNALN